MSLKIPTKLNIALANKEDAVQTFKTVVNNGQGRLALEVLLDIVDGLIAKIEELDKKISQDTKPAVTEAPKQQKAAGRSKAQQEPVVEEAEDVASE